MLWRKFGNWNATADEDGHLNEAAPVKRFLRELRFLASQEGPCLHSWRDGPLLGRAFAVKPQRPQGLRLWAQGLDGESTRRAIIVWAMLGARGFLSERVNLPFVVRRSSVEVRFYLVHLIQGGALIEVCGTRRINLYPVGIAPRTKVPHASLRGQRGSKEDGTHLLDGVLQPCAQAVTHPPWIGMFLLRSSGFHPCSHQFRTAPVGTMPVSK